MGEGEGKSKERAGRQTTLDTGEEGWGVRGYSYATGMGLSKKQAADSVVDSVVGRQKECHDDVT